MIRRRAMAGLALLCALLLSAFAAQSASAIVVIHATNTTSVTCLAGGGNLDFSDAHCDNKVTAGTGSFGHQAISAGTKTAVDITNNKTKNNTTEAEPAVLTTSHLGVNIEITCETVGSEGSSVENVEKEGKHTFFTFVIIKFSKCKVVKPLNCTVKEPIVTTANGKGVEGLKFEAEEKGMGVEFTAPEGKNFAEISFEGEKCTFKGKTFPVTGSTVATGTPEPTQATKHSGATSVYRILIFDTLKFSTSNADFTGKFTTNMSGGGSPIALTTVT